jgi:O-6-methylguanine DNA methyltransferase
VTATVEAPFVVETASVSLVVTLTGAGPGAQAAVKSIQLRASVDRKPTSTLGKQISRELLEYFSCSRKRFTFPMKLEGTPFDMAVWEQLQTIPYGQTRTYGEVAASLGKPGAARAVGGANHRNPIPIVIPCHRVVAAGGKLGGYGGGLDLKRHLLALEGAQMEAFAATALAPTDSA